MSIDQEGFACLYETLCLWYYYERSSSAEESPLGAGNRKKDCKNRISMVRSEVIGRSGVQDLNYLLSDNVVPLNTFHTPGGGGTRL